jgi:pteridine reductase
MNPTGKTALITGAAKRVGRAIALHLAHAGANIFLHYHNSESEAQATAAEIRATGVQCHLFQANLACEASIQQMLTALQHTGPVDILVNSASVFYKTKLAEITQEHWSNNIDVNLRAPFLLSQALGAQMKARGAGKIINIVDCAVRRPYKNYLPYLVSKGGLLTLTEVLALELAPEVQVNCVAPGTVLLPENASDKMKEAALKKSIVGHTGSPEDVAAMVLHLVKHGDFQTGGYYPVDGGAGL